jgi:hypothetical protein
MTISAMRGWIIAASWISGPYPLIANACFDGFGVRLKGLLGLSMLRAQNRTDIRAV